MGESVRVATLFVGRIGLLAAEGHASAIVKHEAKGPLRIGSENLEGDEQADRRVHGGPDRALNHYPAEHYAFWRAGFPAASIPFRPGDLGENLSTLGWTEADVHIGDVFRFGSALLQLSQPRFPCWKVNHRSGVEDLAREMVATGRSGWLYRVLEPGVAQAGDELVRVKSHPDGVSVASLWEIQRSHRPPLDELARMAALEPLAEAWRRRFQSRLQWLSG